MHYSHDGYPLQWPTGWPRTEPGKRHQSRYRVSFAEARDDLLHELDMLNAKVVMLSSNLPLRRDGIPYAASREPSDPGVAVYWTDARGDHVVACDSWRTVRENVRAVGLTVAALRALERTGASEILDRAYTGFTALPEVAGDTDWRVTLGFDPRDAVTEREVRERYRQKARELHPDAPGGDTERFKALGSALERALRELGGEL